MRIRSLLTSIGTMVGVFAIVSLLSLGESTVNEMNSIMKNLDPEIIKLAIYEEDKEIDLQTLSSIKNQNNTVAVSSCYKTKCTIENGMATDEYDVVFTDEQYIKVFNYELEEGRSILNIDNIANNKCVLLGSLLAKKMFGRCNIVGEKITINNQEFDVVGVLQMDKETFSDNINEQAIIPINTGDSSFGFAQIDEVLIRVADVNKADETIKEIKSLIISKYGENTDFRVHSNKQSQSVFNQSNRLMMAFLGSVGSLSLLISGIGIMNIMIVSVTERTKEIGIRKAIGANDKDILLHFLLEAVLLSIFGGILGIILSFLLSGFIGAIIDVKMIISMRILLIALSFSLITGIVFGMFPAFKASRMQPVTALRHE